MIRNDRSGLRAAALPAALAAALAAAIAAAAPGPAAGRSYRVAPDSCPVGAAAPTYVAPRAISADPSRGAERLDAPVILDVPLDTSAPGPLYARFVFDPSAGRDAAPAASLAEDCRR